MIEAVLIPPGHAQAAEPPVVSRGATECTREAWLTALAAAFSDDAESKDPEELVPAEGLESDPLVDAKGTAPVSDPPLTSADLHETGSDAFLQARETSDEENPSPVAPIVGDTTARPFNPTTEAAEGAEPAQQSRPEPEAEPAQRSRPEPAAEPVQRSRPETEPEAALKTGPALTSSPAPGAESAIRAQPGAMAVPQTESRPAPETNMPEHVAFTFTTATIPAETTAASASAFQTAADGKLSRTPNVIEGAKIRATAMVEPVRPTRLPGDIPVHSGVPPKAERDLIVPDGLFDDLPAEASQAVSRPLSEAKTAPEAYIRELPPLRTIHVAVPLQSVEHSSPPSTLKAADAPAIPAPVHAAGFAAMAFQKVVSQKPDAAPLTDHPLPSAFAGELGAPAVTSQPIAAPRQAPEMEVRPAIQTLTQTIIRSDGNSVDVALSPEELGSVRISMSQTETGLSVTLFAEREDTMHLLKRHAGELASALRSAGIADPQIGFGGSGTQDRPAQQASPARRQNQPEAAAAAPPLTLESHLRRSLAEGLDLRF